MKLNVALDSLNKKQAQQLRTAWYSDNTTANQIRDSYIFQQCVDRFEDDIEALSPYIETDPPYGTTQRMLTIREGSYKRLETLAAALNTSLAAGFRAIIAYQVAHVKNSVNMAAVISENTEKTQLLTAKISLLEAQLGACNKTIAEIKALVQGGGLQ